MLTNSDRSQSMLRAPRACSSGFRWGRSCGHKRTARLIQYGDPALIRPVDAVLHHRVVPSRIVVRRAIVTTWSQFQSSGCRSFERQVRPRLRYLRCNK